MHSEIATDLRAECARILARHYGGIPDAIAAIKISTVQRVADYVEHAEDRAAACTCTPVKGFEIDVRRDKPLHAMFIARRLERMAREEAA